LTSPLKDEQQRSNWLLRYLGVQRVYDKVVIDALEMAAIDADHAFDNLGTVKIGERTRRYQINLARKELRKIINDLFRGFVPVIGKGQQDAAQAAEEAAIKEDAKVLAALFPDANLRKANEAAFKESARQGIQAMVNRVIGVSPTYPLSRRVYRAGSLASGKLDRDINSSLARGASARELADIARKSVSPKVAGGVSYAALRLARTEINNAFHAQSIGSMEDKPWVESVHWNLSKVHTEDPGDLCEEYADIGTFDKTNVPVKPHPQCMCYITPDMADFADFAASLQSGAYDEYYHRKYTAA
jgi:hypothetical protein